MPSDSGARAPSGLRDRSPEHRRAAPAVTYPPELPVTGARTEILAAIAASQITIVAGETGSGKTTQLPKMCFELGRGVDGRIGHTQPRRLAARTVAERVAEELGVRLGEEVGYQVRFTDRSSDATLVKLMTDGILLAEIQRDPTLSAYDTIILDEAHERSLNIDFLLGYLQQLLPQRPDLKVIITSATIDLERFANRLEGATVVEVPGRTYHVEVRHRPLPDESDDGEGGDQIQGICDAVDELCGEGPGDILVFCSGEREIRDTAEALAGLGLQDTEILPLYARLSTAEQQRVFRAHTGRRVVLSTNVAETSLTVPGIRYVVDPGTARISRYSTRTKVQRLPIEKISRASADQRKGRCGRVAEGICIRLYSEEDFDERPEYTDPEILRTNLASVILQMTALGLGDIDAFPFVDPPDRRSVRDAFELLHELGAVGSPQPGSGQRLTPIGRNLARLPVDPRLGRMLVAGDANGCLREILVIVAALSIQDPRQRPEERRGEADEQHARFADPSSDFTAYLNLWEYVRAQQRGLSSSAFRRMCRREFLHHLRIREWQDLHSQLRSVAKESGCKLNERDAEPEQVHRALLSGLLSHVGLRPGDAREYLGTRGTRFAIWPGSGLARKPPQAVMVAELVETSRLWARTVARIEPRWAEELAGHLVKRTYSEPQWDARRGAAVAYEKVTLHGVPLVSGRKVAFGGIDPDHSRELFLRHALVEGDWPTEHAFVSANRRVLTDLSDLEHRTRRRDLVADEDTLYEFYDARVPSHVTSAKHFDKWWKSVRAERPGLLSVSREQLLGDVGDSVSGDAYPDVWWQGDLELALTYRFEPGEADDGVSVEVPLAVLGRVAPEGFDWHVPGFRRELVTALLRSLPKALRRSFVPVGDVAAELLTRLRPESGSLLDAMTDELRAMTGVVVPREAWDPRNLPDHLRMTFRVLDGDRVVGMSKDPRELKSRLAGETRGAVAQAAGSLERQGRRTWDFGTLPRSVEGQRDGHTVQGYPALVDEGETVGVRVMLGERQQRRAMWNGTRRLLALSIPPPVRAVHASLDNQAKILLARSPHGSVAALLEDCTRCALDSLLAAHGGPVWDEDAFVDLREAVEGDIVDVVVEIVRAVERTLAAARKVDARLENVSGASGPSLEDARSHRGALLSDGFVTATGRERLGDLPRYLGAIGHRLDKMRADPSRDAALLSRVAEVQEAFHDLLRRREPPANPSEVHEIRWMIEELRVSLFAQHLGTRQRVSEARVLRAIADAG